MFVCIDTIDYPKVLLHFQASTTCCLLQALFPFVIESAYGDGVSHPWSVLVPTIMQDRESDTVTSS